MAYGRSHFAQTGYTHIAGVPEMMLNSHVTVMARCSYGVAVGDAQVSLGAGPACRVLGAGERSPSTLPTQGQEEQALG